MEQKDLSGFSCRRGLLDFRFRKTVSAYVKRSEYPGRRLSRRCHCAPTNPSVLTTGFRARLAAESAAGAAQWEPVAAAVSTAAATLMAQAAESAVLAAGGDERAG